jgi:L-iditol 2-dehydrogenase
MIGLLALQALRAAGCAAVYVTDLDPIRLKLAQQLGATATLPAAKEALIPAILERTQGSGVDVVVEAVGQGAAVASSVECTRKGGTVTLVGNIAAEVPVPLQKIVTRQIRLQGSCAIAGEYPQAIEFLANGKITVRSMISAVVPLEEGQQWFDRLYAHDSALMKVLLTP